MAGMARTYNNIKSFKKALDAATFDTREEFLAVVKYANIEDMSPYPKDPTTPLMVFAQHFGVVPDEYCCQECGSEFTMKVKSETSDRAARWQRRGPRHDRASCCDACGDVEISMTKGTLLADVKASNWLPFFDCMVMWAQEYPHLKIVHELGKQHNVAGPWMEKFQDVAASYIADKISLPKLHEAFKKLAKASGKKSVKKTISKKKQAKFIVQADEVFLNKSKVKKQRGFTTNHFENRWSVLKRWLKKRLGGRLPTTSDRRKWARWVTEFQYRKNVTKTHSVDDGNTYSLPTKAFLSHVAETEIVTVIPTASTVPNGGTVTTEERDVTTWYTGRYETFVIFVMSVISVTIVIDGTTTAEMALTTAIAMRIATGAQELAAVGPEFKATLKDKQDRIEEMKLRKQSKYVAQAMKSSFGDKLSKLLESADTDGKAKLKEKECDREASPTPVAQAPDSTALMKRPELGWLQSLVGAKKQLPNRLTWAQAAQVLEERMSDKMVVAQVNKWIQAHFPKRAVPVAKARRINLTLGIINGSAL
ncbi:unnamed protein product [Prorocentrum cordatum]|uniref:Uncharacterized protein n=1 Tax=Prorocentrum cordatum TaxID=2364126 RepID=A0ABN9WEB9_9DINO|nr:unnamed protein product [Polarella glacialis]